MNDIVNSGEGTGKVKFDYIEQYPEIYKGKIAIFRDQRKWHNKTYDDLLSKMAWLISHNIFRIVYEVTSLCHYYEVDLI